METVLTRGCNGGGAPIPGGNPIWMHPPLIQPIALGEADAGETGGGVRLRKQNRANKPNASTEAFGFEEKFVRTNPISACSLRGRRKPFRR